MLKDVLRLLRAYAGSSIGRELSTWVAVQAQPQHAGAGLDVITMLVPMIESTTWDTKIQGLRSLNRLVMMASAVEINWHFDLLSTVLMRALVFWEEDALSLSLPATVAVMTSAHALHNSAAASKEAEVAMSSCQNLIGQLIRALGMVSRDSQRMLLLDGIAKLVNRLHLGISQYLERLITELLDMMGGGKRSSQLSELLSSPDQMLSRLELRLGCAQLMGTIVRNCWPRLGAHVCQIVAASAIAYENAGCTSSDTVGERQGEIAQARQQLQEELLMVVTLCRGVDLPRFAALLPVLLHATERTPPQLQSFAGALRQLGWLG